MAPPALSSSHLLITASLPKPRASSLRPPRLPHPKPLPAALIALTTASALPALAADAPAPPPAPELQVEAPTPAANPFSSSLLTAPKPSAAADLPEGTQWRYSEFLNAVKRGKVERVRFSKDGGLLQFTAVDGRRATVVVPNDPDLIDILATNGVDISVSGVQRGGLATMCRRGGCDRGGAHAARAEIEEVAALEELLGAQIQAALARPIPVGADRPALPRGVGIAQEPGEVDHGQATPTRFGIKMGNDGEV